MPHLTRDELMAWRDAPAPGARQRIVGHLAACDACAAVYAELIRTSAPDTHPQHFDPQAFTSQGYGTLGEPRGRVFVFERKVFIPLAAAAAIVLAIWLPDRRTAGDGSAGSPVVMRGGRPEAVTPSGDVNGPLEFRWSVSAGATRYAIEVKDAAGRRVFYRETRDEHLTQDAALDAAVRPGVPYTWTVTTLDEAGEAVAQSLPQPFTRAPAPRR